jgi:Protein of unknown function (DUF551)
MNNEEFKEYSIDELIEIFSSHAREYHNEYRPDRYEEPKYNIYFNLPAVYLCFFKEMKEFKKSYEKSLLKEKEIDKWISLSDEMPKQNQQVKVRSDNLWNGEGLFQDGKFVYSYVKGACCGLPTHWMPIEDENKKKKLDG